ncbi:MAG: alpha/beta hydrolase [Bacteriovorax sp.]|nr:alpha/beta hydrolase [Bacteriovorax sp.]
MTKNKIEKSIWFHSDFKSDTVAVVIIAPGLNLLPSKMDELAYFLTSKKCDVFRIALGNNPHQWCNKFSDAYDEALEHAEVIERPLYFLGYSLGALLGEHYMLSNPYQLIKKCVLIAPATYTKFYTQIPAWLSLIFPKGKIKSSNLENYRAKSFTSLLEYKIMRRLQIEVKKKFNILEFNTPTLLVTNPHDELVNSNKLTKIAALNPHWVSLELSNKESQLPKKYHHLMIDSAAIGPSEWKKLLKRLTEHFEL